MSLETEILPAPDPDLDINVLKRRRAKLFATVFVVLLTVVAAGASYFIFRARPVTAKELDQVAQQAIKVAIGVPSQLEFNDLRIEAREFDRYLVSGGVEAIARSGEVGKYRFTCALIPNRDGSWVARDVTLVRQN